jgi:hypothetical protein
MTPRYEFYHGATLVHQIEVYDIIREDEKLVALFAHLKGVSPQSPPSRVEYFIAHFGEAEYHRVIAMLRLLEGST